MNEPSQQLELDEQPDLGALVWAPPRDVDQNGSPRAERLRALTRFAREAARLASFDQIVARALAVVSGALAVDWCVAVTLSGDPPGISARGCAAAGLRADTVEALRRCGSSVVYTCDAEMDEGAGAEILRALSRGDAAGALLGEVRCVAWVPLRSRYTSGIDALALGSTRPRPGLAQGTALAAEQLPFLDLLASQIDAAIENAALRRRLAEQDARIEQRVLARTEELRQANTALAATAKRKDELLAWMAHELRTPLNAVVGYCESLLEGVYGPLSTKQTKSVVTIQHGGEHLLALVGDILDFAKHHAGKLEVRLERVDPVDVAEAALRLVQGAAERKHIDLRLTRDLSLPPLLADERRVTQILVNLLGNALKFTEPWGLVTLDVRMGAGRTDVHFAVTDTGIGIAEKDLSKLFLPFEQGESELGRQHPGTGLGLSLVAALVSLHNGSVSAKSVPGRGSRFEVVLPAHA